MKISYINGICVKNDAISGSVRNEVSWLKESNEVRLFAYACEYEDIPFTKVDSIGEIILDPYFQDSDLIVFHFGIFYPLFDSIYVTPRKAKKIVVYHNITPAEFVKAESKITIEKSNKQAVNMNCADFVICVSKTNQKELVAKNIKSPSKVINLAIPYQDEPPIIKPSFTDSLIRIVFLGRFVKSKGIDDLVYAIKHLVDSSSGNPLKLTLVGNLPFSDQGLIESMCKRFEEISTKNSNFTYELFGDATDSIKAEILTSADLLVLPSYHEGFCVPILEAMAFGCRVLTYDNSNIPSISGGHATLVSTGNVCALAARLLNDFELIRSAQWKESQYAAYLDQCKFHLEQFMPHRVKASFTKCLKDVVNSR